MTLSLDDVRNKRFRMARKSGYEVLEVDEFVDEVEVAVEQLTEENQNLKRQIEALKAAPAAQEAAVVHSDATPAAPAEPETIVVTTGAEASSAVVRLVALSTEQAERLVSEAFAEAATIREDASASAQQVTGDAQARADRISAEARELADRVEADARARADSLDAEIAGRRSELLSGLTVERDELQVAVGQLRDFEATFRANLTNQLQEHLSALQTRTAEPQQVPALADPAAVSEADQRAASQQVAANQSPDAAGETGDAPVSESDEGGSVFPDDDPAQDSDTDRPSETPRLDALLGDQR
jgi:DivIVA domain-containing protein